MWMKLWKSWYLHLLFAVTKKVGNKFHEFISPKVLKNRTHS